MNQPDSISATTCDQIFPLSLCLDLQGTIRKASPRMEMKMTGALIGLRFFDAFKLDIALPSADSFEKNLTQLKKTAILIHSLDNKHAFRGQLIEGWFENKAAYLLLLTPWLTWMINNSNEEVSPLDFPVTDNQLENMFYIKSQEVMRSDLESFSAKLKAEKLNAQAANKAKTHFIAHVSHELRTPLGAISGVAELLRAKGIKDSQNRLMEILENSTQTLLELINNVLEFAELDSEANKPSASKIKPRDLAHQIQSMLSLNASKAGAVITTQFSNRVPQVIIADAIAIKKTLINIIANAIKHSNGKNISVKLDYLKQGSDRGDLIFTVSDDGVGLAQEDITRLFDEFFVAGTKTVGNSGLGLAIVKSLVERAGGQISLRSQLGEGATFEFSYPITVPETESDTVIAANIQPAITEDLSQFNLLLVDDNHINIEIVSLLLKKFGFCVTPAASGIEAVEMCGRNRFDLILMDIKMPEMNGIQATKAIQAGGLNQNTPILAVTANVTQQDRREYLESGMSDVLIKPIDSAELLSASLKALGRTIDLGTYQAEETQNPALNRNRLMDLLHSTGLENSDYVIGIFESQSQQDLTALLEAYRVNQLDTVKSKAHKLASTALQYGLDTLGNLLRSIENETEQNLTSAKQQLICEVRESYTASISSLIKFRDIELPKQLLQIHKSEIIPT